MKVNLKDIVHAIEEYAPTGLQEPYDNAGLQCGNPGTEISSILLTLDVTEEVLDEGIRNGCNLIISHHPVIFKPLKRLTGNSAVERILIKALKNDIAIYSAHTNLDNIAGGVSYFLGQKLELEKLHVLSPVEGNIRHLSVYCPRENTSEVLQALHQAGAGQIGNYRDCSFRTLGKGSFIPDEGSHPAIGHQDVREEVDEEKLEVIFPFYIQQKVLEAMWNAHPYEEVAYQLTEIKNSNQSTGAGVIGELPELMEEKQFLSYLKDKLRLNTIKYTPYNGGIKRIALCGGSGSFLIERALKEKVDAFVTADLKYHEYFAAEGRLLVADIGHYESEVSTKELFYDILRKKFPNIAVLFSSINTNPVKYYH